MVNSPLIRPAISWGGGIGGGTLGSHDISISNFKNTTNLFWSLQKPVVCAISFGGVFSFHVSPRRQNFVKLPQE